MSCNVDIHHSLQRLTQHFSSITINNHSPSPPGTGKSETGAHIAYIFAQLLKDHECVVYCAPSNKAVDVVHGELIVYHTSSNDGTGKNSNNKETIM